MGEPIEVRENEEPGDREEVPEEPQEPTEEPDGGDTPDEGGELPEAPSDEAVRQTDERESEQEIEKTHKTLAAEATRHANRISTIMGEAAQELLPCELCWPPAPGFRFAEMPEEQRSAVLSAIGFQPEPELEEDKTAHRCPDCNGYGKVSTGSHVQGFDAMVCVACEGAGAVGPRFAESAAAPPAAPSMPESNGPASPALSGEELAAIVSLRAKGISVIEPMRG